MPRAGWVKPESDRRLSDLVSVGVLTRVFPPDVVDEVIAAAGRTEQRNRLLPARVVAYFAVGMALYSEGSYEDVLAQLTDGLSWSSRWAETVHAAVQVGDLSSSGSVRFPTVGGVVRGGSPAPLGGPATPGVVAGGSSSGRHRWDRVWMSLTRPRTPTAFGRPGVNKGEQAAFPQARVVALAECGTHAIFDALIGAYTTP